MDLDIKAINKAVHSFNTFVLGAQIGAAIGVLLLIVVLIQRGTI